MSLADELLADLEEEAAAVGDAAKHEDVTTATNDVAMTEQDSSPTEQARCDGATNGVVGSSGDGDRGRGDTSVRSLLTLANSERLRVLMAAVEECLSHERRAEDIVGPAEADPEYQLVVEANRVASEFDAELAVVHKFCRDLYSRRFPELDSLVTSPLEYMLTAQELGNDLERAKNNETLQQVLTQATIMVVSVTASTTQSQPLSEEQLERLMDACRLAMELNAQKLQLYGFIESRMNFIAPNLTALVGADTAAKLMGAAGGLTALSKMPACNVQLVGAERRALSGFSATSVLPHTGFIYYSPTVQLLAPDLRRKAARVLAAKVALACRVDSFHESVDGEAGRRLRDEVVAKLDKMQEPPPVKAVKPLPTPVDAPGKRRGGKRVRKMKERFAVTELRKQANRMAFGEIEDDAYQQDLSYSRGTIGKGGAGGSIRAAPVDEKTKVRISKTLQRNLQKQQSYGGATSVRRPVAGTASSVAFTPLQGLEIINPQAADSGAATASGQTSGYFSSTASFVKVQRR